MNLDEELKIYMQTVQCLDESMDDYLYVYDLANDQLYFADKIREKYDLPLGKEGNFPFLSGQRSYIRRIWSNWSKISGILKIRSSTIMIWNTGLWIRRGIKYGFPAGEQL